MAQVNQAPRQTITHEGAPAKRINAKAELERSVMACMLWESQFYEDGVEIAKRIGGLVAHIDARENR